jgi:hypothetical protein
MLRHVTNKFVTTKLFSEENQMAESIVEEYKDVLQNIK